MCQALRELMNDEIQEEIKTAEEKAAQEAAQKAAQKAVDTTWLTAIKNLMSKKKCDAKTAMEELCISAADQHRYIAML